MRLPFAHPVLGLACALAWGTGVWLTAGRVPWRVEGAGEVAPWSLRYRALKPLLADAERAFFVHDRGAGQARHLLFRAQFEVAPCVLEERPHVGRVPVPWLRTRPLILDFHDEPALAAALVTLRETALERGLALEVERLPGRLALVRAVGEVAR